MRYCIGIDLGGTNIAGGIADLDGKLLLTDSIKTGLPCPASDIADRIALLCRRMATALGLALSDAAWVGIGAPGSVDVDTGTVLYAAEGKLAAEDIPMILDSGNRTLAGPTAPPGGLYLTRIWYNDERLER